MTVQHLFSPRNVSSKEAPEQAAVIPDPEMNKLVYDHGLTELLISGKKVRAEADDAGRRAGSPLPGHSLYADAIGANAYPPSPFPGTSLKLRGILPPATSAHPAHLFLALNNSSTKAVRFPLPTCRRRSL